MEQQLREAVGGERKMSELIAFLLQGRSSVLFACDFCWGAHIVLFCLFGFWFLYTVGGTPLRESIGEDLAIELLRMGAKSHE